ncbi:hypothetical protein [Solwaraspora sp. WMMA2101]|uniref:hypothetical protein n=1 Tax=Solwaraspora sp. WMMA2101 TaxID=3404124 RepID=UPI003B944E95
MGWKWKLPAVRRTATVAFVAAWMCVAVGPVAGPAAAAPAPADPTPSATVATPVAAPASPDADLAVRITGATINAPGYKSTVITVTNHGPGTASGIILDLSESRVDSEAVDAGTIYFCDTLPGTMPPYDPPSPDPDFPNRGYDIPVAGECALDDLPAGRSIRLETRIRPWIGAGMRIGVLRATVRHDGRDPDPANDSTQAPVSIAGSPVTDVYVRAWDVPYLPDDPAATVAPGDTTALRYEVGNVGTVPVTGITLTVRLPEHVTFAETLPGCRYAADRAEATCAYPELVLATRSAQTGSAVVFTHPVQVGAGAPAPAVLAGGVVTAAIDEVADPVALAAADPVATLATLPAGAVAATAVDVDPSDNQDTFTVLTAPPGGDGLPVTGPSVATLVGLGLVAVLLGMLVRVVGTRSAGRRR